MNFFENSSSSKVWDLAESSMSLGKKKGNPTIFFFFNERSSVRLFCSDIELVLNLFWSSGCCISALYSTSNLGMVSLTVAGK